MGKLAQDEPAQEQERHRPALDHEIAHTFRVTAATIRRNKGCSILKWTNYFVANLGDESTFFSPGLTYSLQSNLDLTVGAQWLQGGADTEYGRLSDTYYAQFQWFF